MLVLIFTSPRMALPSYGGFNVTVSLYSSRGFTSSSCATTFGLSEGSNLSSTGPPSPACNVITRRGGLTSLFDTSLKLRIFGFILTASSICPLQ